MSAQRDGAGGNGRKDALAHAAVLRRPLADLPDPLPMLPIDRPFACPMRPPGSKSLSNRALLLAALAQGDSLIHGALIDADDGAVMIEALRALGAEITPVGAAEAGALRVRGRAGRLRGGCSLNLQNAGTATRFLAAAACLADGPVVIDGDARMRERPIGELVAMLRSLGAHIEETSRPGFVPLRVHPVRPTGGRLTVGRTMSSQFISAVMMIAPWTDHGIEIVFDAPPTSPAYIEMTRALMEQVAGGSLRIEGSLRTGGVAEHPRLSIPAQPMRAFQHNIEPDASGATYFWAAAAIVPTASCLVDGIGSASLQGDAQFANVLGQLGATVDHNKAFTRVSGPASLRGGEWDLSLMPDAAMTLAAVACFANGPTTIRGLRTLRVKETDRIAAMQRELAKIGARVETFSEGADEGIVITPPSPPASGGARDAALIEFDTYNDHRMAMSLALIGLRRPNVLMRDPACVRKTYPRFWADLARLYT